VKLHYHYYQVKEDPSVENMDALKKELTFRTEVDKFFKGLFPNHKEAVTKGTVPNPTDFDCLRSMIDTYEDKCHKLEDYSLKWVKYFVAECEGTKSYPDMRSESLKKIETECQSNSYFQSLKTQTPTE